MKIVSDTKGYARIAADLEPAEKHIMDTPLDPKLADPGGEQRGIGQRWAFPMTNIACFVSLWQRLSSEIFAALQGSARASGTRHEVHR